MTYEKLVDTIRKYYNKLDASTISEHFAIQFNIEGEAEGAFYVEFSDGEIDVQPYEYYDRDIILTMDARTAIDIASGDITLEDSYNSEKTSVWGEYDKAIEIYRKIFSKSKERTTRNKRK